MNSKLLFLGLALGACGSPEPAQVPEADVAVEARADVREPEATNAVVGDAIPAQPGHYGQPFTLAASEPLQTLIDAPDPYVGKTVRVSGEVTNVCQKAGCWMVVRAEGGESVRVVMKDHGFSVAKDASGLVAHVEGTVVRKAVDPETVAHYESEGGGDAVPEKGKDEVYEIVAVAVEIEPKA